MRAAAAYRDILGPDNFFLEMQWHGIEEQRAVNSGIPSIARELSLPMVCTNDVHYLRDTDAHAHDVLLCIGTGKAVQRSEATAVRRAAVLPEDRGRDGCGIQGLSRRARQHDAHRRALRRHARERNESPADVRRALTVSRRTTYFEHVVREGFKDRLAAAARTSGGRPPEAHHRRVRTPARLRARHHPQDRVSGLPPDRLGLHPLRA